MDLRILILSALVAAASAVPLSSTQCARQCDGVQPFETQKTYQYSYSIETSSFVNDSNSQDQPRDASVLKLQCNVEVLAQSSCEVFLRVKDVTVRERSSSGQEITSPKQTEIKNALEAHWLRFAFQDGIVKEVCPEEGEDKWTLNIKRGMLSALQSPVPQIPQDVKQPMMSLETDVTGTCPVYLSQPITGGIIKQKNYDGCKDRTKLEGAIQAIKLTPYAPLFNIMDSTQSCSHQLRSPFIVASSTCNERHLVRPFTKHNTGIVTTIVQTLTFTERRDGGSPPSRYQQERQTDIVFEHLEEEMTPDPQGAKNMIFSYCHSFTEDDKQKERPEYFSELIKLLDHIDDAGFMSVRQYATNDATCRGSTEQIKKFFIDAVAMCESTACINGMVGMLAVEDLVQSSVAELWISSLPFIRKPTSDMIPTLMNLVKAEPVQPQVFLAVSSLIHNYCIREGVDCSQDDNFRNALDYFENALDHDCSPRGEMTNDQRLKLIVSLKSIGNIGNIGDAHYLSATLTRCMQRTNDIDIRLAAIDAFRRLPCDEEERSELMNLYKNTAGDTELRIDAYLAMMQCANEGILEVVVETMEIEKDDQVGSFVVSHLKNLNESSDPQKQEIKELLRKSVVMRRFSRDIRKMSRNYEISFFNEKMMTGAAFESNVIFSKKSFLPRSVSVDGTADIFGYAIKVFGIGGRMEGMQHLMETFLGPSGYLKESDTSTIMQRLMSYLNLQPPQAAQQQEQVKNKRDVDQDRMDNIINEFDVPQEDKPMASVYMKVFDNEIAFMDYDAIMEKFNEWKKSANIMQILTKLATEQTIDVSRSNKMVKMSSCIPTVAGLPLSLSVDGNSVTQMTASGRLNILGAMMAPRSLHIEGSVKPSVAVELSTTLEINVHHTKTGLNHVARLHSDSILDGALIVENGNSMRVKLNVPEEKQTIVDVSSKIFHLHQQDKAEITGDSQSQFSQEVCTAEVTAKYLGVRICSDLTFPTVFTRPQSPSMLLAGPSDIKMTLAKVDPHLASFEMEVTKMVNKEMVNGEVVVTDVFRLMVGTPNTPVQRTYSINYSLNRNERHMTLEIESPFKSANIEATVIGEELHKKLDLSLRMNPNTAQEKAFRMIAEQEIENPSENVMRYIPRFEFTGPKGNNVQLTGSVINNDELRRIDVDLQLIENSSPVITVNGPITRTEGTKKSAYGIEMMVDGRYIQGQLTGQVNRNKEAYTISVDMKKKVRGQLMEQPWASVSFIYGSNKDDTMFRLVNEVEFPDFSDWSYHFEIESRGTPLNHENTVKLCYRGIECNTDTKVALVQNNTATMTPQGAITQALQIRYNHPAQNKQYEVIQNLNANLPQGFNWTISMVDDVANTNLFTGDIRLDTSSQGNFRVEMGTPRRFFSTVNNWHLHDTGRIDVTSILRHNREKTTSFTFAYAPTMNVHDVDLDIVLPDQREVNIGSRLDNNLDQGMLDFDFTIDKFGVENWVAIIVDYRDTSDNTKWEHRASVDIQTPLVCLQNKRLEGGVKKMNNKITSDIFFRYNPDRPKVGVEFIFTNNTNEYDTHGQVDLIFTTVSHSITLSSAGGYQEKTNEKVCNLLASVNLRQLTDQGEGKTFGIELNYSNSTNESRIKHSVDFRGYAPDHEINMDTYFKLEPGTNNLMSSFDFKWEKDQQGLTLEVSLLNTSDSSNRRVAVTAEMILPEQNLILAFSHSRGEFYYDRSLVVTLNEVEKANLAFTYTRALNGDETICSPTVNILIGGKRIIWDATLKHVDNQVSHLESSIKHNDDTEPSLSILLDITKTDTETAKAFDLTFNVVSKYVDGYDTSFQWSRTAAVLTCSNAITLTMDGTQRMILNFGHTKELPPNVPASVLDIPKRLKSINFIYDIDVDFSFPQMEDEVFRNLAMNLRMSCAVCDKTLILKWGNKGTDETITIAQTTVVSATTVDFDLTFTHPFTLPLIHPTFGVGVDLNLAQPSPHGKFEITTADNKKRAIQVIYTNSSLTPPLKQAVEVILTRSDKDDIKIKGELKALTADAIADLTITCEYSALQNEHLEINTKLVNRSNAVYGRRASELEFHVDHPVSNVEIDMFINTNNDTRDVSIGLEGAIRVGTEHGAITLEASWDKRDKQYIIHHSRESLQSVRRLDRESYEVTFTGQFEDKSYGDYRIYELDMMNDYNGQRIPSFFKFDGRDKQIEFDVNFNPDDRSDYWRFKVGYLNSSAIAAKIDTRRGLTHTINASVLLYLQAPKVLYTQINWHPEWPQDMEKYLFNVFNTTVEKIQRRENVRFYVNQTLTQVITQWKTFQARNADVPVKMMGLIQHLNGMIRAAKPKWLARGLAAKASWTAFATDMQTTIIPYIIQANTTLQTHRAKLPLIKAKITTETQNYFKAASTALEGYKTHCLLPIFGSMMMNIQQLNTCIRTDITNLKLQTLAKVLEFNRNLNETIESMQLEWLVRGVKLLTWVKEINATVSSAFAERFEAIKTTMLRNPIMVDIIRWGILAKDLVPIQQWNETMRALYTEFSTSNDIAAIKQFFGQMKQLAETRRVNMAAYWAANPRNLTWLNDKLLSALVAWSESQQNYKLVKADIENGEIIVLFYLQEDLQNLQELPPSLKDTSLMELRNQLGAMAPLIQNQVRTQIMDPQVQKIGIYEAANLLNMLNGNPNMTFQLMQQLTLDKMRTKYWNFVNLMTMLRCPRNWIPPYDANAMIVHNQHYMTFDRRYYEFAGRCTYLLAHDFLNGNFSIYVDYSSSEGEMTKKTLIVKQDQQIFTVSPDLTVTDGNRIKDLPLRVGNITITRESNRVKVHNSKGVTVTCTTPYEICHVSMSGWYYGQTAGLFGTYDYEAKNDFTMPNNQVTDTIDKFTRQWEVSTACSTTTNRAHKCTDVDPSSAQNKLCQEGFLSFTSPFRPLFDMVDPEPFYKMCVNDMCGLQTEAQRKEKICEVYKAYLTQRPDIPMPMPQHCIKCETSNGTVITPEKPVKIENATKEADVVFIVEEKRCAEGTIADKLHDIAIRLDTELRRNNITNNRFALVGFGGEDIHNLPHPHTIDGALFNNASRFRLGVEALDFGDDGSNDTLAAILRAANYPFRAGASKNIILISCSDCQYHQTKYSTVASILIDRGIQFNMLMSHQFNVKSKDKKNKSSKEQVYGFDDLAVYTAKMAGQPTLKGDQSLRKYINEPLNKCTVLAMETNGSVFNVNEIGRKGFQEVFVLRMVKESQPMPCQICKCIPNKEWVGESVCERCGAVTPTEALLQAFKNSMGDMLVVPNKSPAYTVDGVPTWGSKSLKI